ncbi:aldehyde dehydrogenase family protein [Sphingomonas canadensis]|uniref:Aldehyde dehydrogenase family protein n=1 Tax=Sphingomonas canadensis TaxID=1219257 RepID=A0ABW3HB69_9SPHN|nr:aldehyde dehydrogenase family protein [Sphingomonas canadensis]MCW3838347.1 aldehyde dehydrogenase family protein [Sphingomonas canadensis]
MRSIDRFYIGGRWVEPAGTGRIEVIDPATEQPCGSIAAGCAEDVDRAVAAARAAFPAFAQTSREERIALLERLADAYDARAGELAAALTEEMGAPASLAANAQVPLGSGHLRAAARALAGFAFEEAMGATRIVREPIGVAGMITPWNWPLHQIGCKVAPAIATGCTMVLKPSEAAPFDAQIFAEIVDAAGVPAGVFNLVHGDGPGVGAPMAAHPDIDLISFTGSTGAGVAVAQAAAPSVKRVCQELGGKSALIALDDARLADSVAGCVDRVMANSGQSCNAPTRLLVPAHRMAEAAEAARAAAERVSVGDPRGNSRMGPVVSGAQWAKIQALIRIGLEEGATLVAGGPGRPDGLDRGFYVRPTVFADVRNGMTIAREEIFGPVLCIIGYDSPGDAIAIANDSPYGLSAAVSGEDVALARSLARMLRAGEVLINGAWDIDAPFGGYRQSGNGREKGVFAFHDFLEVKAIVGYGTGE